MSYLSTKAKIVLVSASVLGLGLALGVKHTDACRLEAVSLNNAVVDDWRAELPPLTGASIANQRLDSLAGTLLARPDGFKVDMRFTGFNSLDIKTNDFAPACFLLDGTTGRLRALDRFGRLAPLPVSDPDWERPVLTNAGAGKMFERLSDPRVDGVVKQLNRLRSKHGDLYRLIEEIDFANKRCLVISVAGLSYKLKTNADGLYGSLERFAEFVTRFDPQLDEAVALDLRFDNMIVCAEGAR